MPRAATKTFTQHFMRNAPARDREYVVRDAGQQGLALRVRPGPRRTLFVTYTDKCGKPVKFSLGDPTTWTLPTARAKAAEILIGLREGIDPKGDKQAQLKRVKDAANLILRSKDAQALERVDYLNSVAKNVLDGLGDVPLAGLDRTACEQWYTKLQDRAPSMANRSLSFLRRVIKRANAEGWMQGDPSAELKRKKERGRKRYLNAEERTRTLAVLRQHAAQDDATGQLCKAIMLSLETGCRIGEAYAMRRSEIDGNVCVPAKHKNSHRGDVRVIHLSNTAKAILSSVPNTGDALFPALIDAHTRTTSALWKPLREEAGIPDVQLRDMRRSWGTHALNSGISVEVVSKALDHSNIRTTQEHYSFMEDATVSAALAQLESSSSEGLTAEDAR